MGTNYYITTKVCKKCGRGEERKHIGKSSSGWCFALRVYHPGTSINDLDGWKPWLFSEDSRIEDEYGVMHKPEEMLGIITNRTGRDDWDKPPYGYDSWDQFHAINRSQAGPNGLLRSRLGEAHCVGHGAGTWDCFEGEFS